MYGRTSNSRCRFILCTVTTRFGRKGAKQLGRIGHEETQHPSKKGLGRPDTWTRAIFAIKMDQNGQQWNPKVETMPLQTTPSLFLEEHSYSDLRHWPSSALSHSGEGFSCALHSSTVECTRVGFWWWPRRHSKVSLAPYYVAPCKTYVPY